MRVWIHPTRTQLEMAYMKNSPFEDLKSKVRFRLTVEPFNPEGLYHATVVVGGCQKRAESVKTAIKVLMDCPLGFDFALSYTIHTYSHGRPLIGLLAAPCALDRNEALLHFADCGDIPDASGNA